MPQGNQVKTIPITNFGGRLTRKLNGDLNSGFAKFTTSFGYDPFSKPDNLTWFEAPTDITGSITDLIVVAKTRFEAGSMYVYAVGNAGKLYKIQANSPSNPNLDTTSVIGAIAANSPTFNFGASMEFFGTTEKIYVGSDSQINSVNFDGSGDAEVGGASNYVANVYRPLLQFVGKLFYGNKNNVGAIDSTSTIVSSVQSNGQISPQLPNETYITDLDLSPDGNYAFLTASNVSNENISTVASDRQSSFAGQGVVFKWNGVDVGITSLNYISSYELTALQSYLNNNIFFANDAFGASLNDGTNKILTLPGNKSPFANATTTNGNFLTWVAPELNSAGNGLMATMYYFGSLDGENQPGLWRVMRYNTTLSNGFVYQTPVNLMVNNKYSTVNNAITSIITLGYGKHYFSTFEVNSSNNSYKLFRFLITPTGTGTPQLGVYETQTQLFSKKITVKQVRVYTEPTISGNGFQIDLIGSDGSVMTNGTKTYTFAAGTDVTLLQGALQRIDMNPTAGPSYALGLRITNTGTTNMTIHKIEVDYVESGK